MNSKKICFITCVNNDEVYQECLLYIHNLDIPQGYSVETVSVKEAVSMASGLNQAMQKSDAKYKVYLHQDVFIINRKFIHDMLHIFENPSIGLIGVIGCSLIPENGVWWEAERIFGQVYDSHRGFIEKLAFSQLEGEYQEVDCIDGLMMITQVDIPWRDDLFTGWHFYDLSQSREFRRNHYQVVVPHQSESWCIHDCGLTRVCNEYNLYREIFIQEYLQEDS
ncbi:hypothetical protein HA075_11265 [bacterium BFN5]|nr:hypothetical protein HA075_11190 [bacterium BFN5]QJW46357.1 hypothetical protein HA075_11265 [bacterium BFN5]